MSTFEILIAIIGGLMTVLGTIGTIFLNRLLKSLDNMGRDINGIKVTIGEISNTQSTHEDKFDVQDRRIDKIENKLFKFT